VREPVGLFLAYRGFGGSRNLNLKTGLYLVISLVGADGIEPPTAGV